MRTSVNFIALIIELYEQRVDHRIYAAKRERDKFTIEIIVLCFLARRRMSDNPDTRKISSIIVIALVVNGREKKPSWR